MITPLSTSRFAHRLMRSNQRGVSLIELMIAMTLGLAIIAAVGYVYVSGTTGYRVQNNQSRMQEDARFIIETVSRDVRMAGYFGCTRSDTVGKQAYVELLASQPVMTLDTGWLVGGSDTKNIDRFLDTGYFLRGISASSANASPALPGYAKLSGSLQPNTDVLLIIRAGDEHAAVESVLDANTSVNAGEVKLKHPLPGVKTADNVTLVISNCEVAKIVKPTFTVISSGSLAASMKSDNGMNHSNSGAGGAADTLGDSGWGDDAIVSMFAPSIFYVAKPASTGALPSLKRATIAQNSAINYGGWASNGGDIVATGVESFTTSYMVTTDIGTNTATSQETSLAALEATPANWQNVTAVRVRFTMVSQESGTAVTTADGKFRQSYDFLVGIRGRQYKGAN